MRSPSSWGALHVPWASGCTREMPAGGRGFSAGPHSLAGRAPRNPALPNPPSSHLPLSQWVLCQPQPGLLCKQSLSRAGPRPARGPLSRDCRVLCSPVLSARVPESSLCKLSCSSPEMCISRFSFFPTPFLFGPAPKPLSCPASPPLDPAGHPVGVLKPWTNHVILC